MRGRVVKHDVSLLVPSSMTPPHEHSQVLIHQASLVPCGFLTCIMLPSTSPFPSPEAK
jgi:hypothetical protein